jgi:hypothetical protein
MKCHNNRDQPKENPGQVYMGGIMRDSMVHPAYLRGSVVQTVVPFVIIKIKSPCQAQV